jgi:hypothetical protein
MSIVSRQMPRSPHATIPSRIDKIDEKFIANHDLIKTESIAFVPVPLTGNRFFLIFHMKTSKQKGSVEKLTTKAD